MTSRDARVTSPAAATAAAGCAMALDLAKSLVNATQYEAVHLMEPILPKLPSEFPEISWPLIGDAIVTKKEVAQRLSRILERPPFAGKREARILYLSQDAMFAWCHAHPDHAPAFVGGVLPVLEPSRTTANFCLHPAMERLLMEFGDREDVKQSIIENIDSLGWSRSQASKYAQLEASLTALGSHREEQVRHWAKKMLKYVEDRNREALRFDEERKIRAEFSQW